MSFLQIHYSAKSFTKFWEVTLTELEELLNASNPVQFDFLSHITDKNLRERLKDKGEYVPF